MATSFIANHVLFSPTISASFSSSKHPQLKLSARSHSSALTPCGKIRCLGISSSNYRPVMPSSRLPLAPAAAAAAYSSVKSDDGVDDVQMPGEDDQEHLPSLTMLIDAYKKAFFSDDENKLIEIEAKIYKIEKEKQELLKKLSSLSTEMSSGKVNYIRLQADFDNFRKRSDKDKLNVTTNARREVIENLLTVVDDFEKTKQQVRPETEKEKKIDTSYQGIYKQFVEVMRSFNVSVVATVGKPFDPSVHEAIAREPSQEFKEGIIIRELQRGFLLKDQLLRPAKVKVSSGPGGHKAKAAASLDSAAVDER